MSEPKIKKPRAPKIQPTTIVREPLPRKENGNVDWRKCVSPENVYLNRNYWARQGKDVTVLDEREIEQLISESPDEGLIIKLAGFREIARKRGVKETIYKLEDRVDGRAVVSCRMTLVPTTEEPYETVISGIASVDDRNAGSWQVNFADSIASNRAEARCWRAALNIVSVADEELNPMEKPEEVASTPKPVNLLIERMEGAGYTKDDISLLIKDAGFTPPMLWNGQVEKLDPPSCFSLISFLKDKTK